MKTLTSKLGFLPLTVCVLNIHSNATHNVWLKIIYKMQANAEKTKLWSYIVEEVEDHAMMDVFVKGADALQVPEGEEVCGSESRPQTCWSVHPYLLFEQVADRSYRNGHNADGKPKVPNLHFKVLVSTSIIAGQAVLRLRLSLDLESL
jgi:hypothetical protein